MSATVVVSSLTSCVASMTEGVGSGLWPRPTGRTGYWTHSPALFGKRMRNAPTPYNMST